MNLLNIFQSRGDKFYNWFEEASRNNQKGAQLLEKLCKNFKNPKAVAEKIHDLEHEGDQISHLIHKEINSAFVTPIDREDILHLTNALDDVIDLIHASTSTILAYNVKKMTPIAIKFSEIILESTAVVARTLPYLKRRRSFPQIQKAIVEINRLENEADDLLRKGLSELFKKPKNPIDVIRWRDIYEIMEDTTDKIEEIAHVLQDFITKYA